MLITFVNIFNGGALAPAIINQTGCDVGIGYFTAAPNDGFLANALNVVFVYFECFKAL